MGLTTKTSERNTDARAVLASIYEEQLRVGQAQAIVELGREDTGPLGMRRDRWLAAAERLVERGLLKRAGQTAFSIRPHGVDLVEDPEALDRELPVLRGAPAVPPPIVESALASISSALSDAEAAIARGEPGSAVDRVHTALHARVRELCDAHEIGLDPQAALPAAFSTLWNGRGGARPEAKRILRSLGAIVEALTQLRNHASLAHPGDVLDDAEALLAINATRTVIAYIEARFGVLANAPDAP